MILKIIKRARFITGLLALLSACVVYLFWAGDANKRLKWAHVYEIGSPYHQNALWAASEFERKTEGRYQIIVFPASSLGSEVALNEAVSLGSVDIIYTGASLAAQRHASLAISDYPYVIGDFAHWQAYRRSGLFGEFRESYEVATGDVIMDMVFYGFRHVTSNKPIFTPSDMRNLKIRVPNSPAFMLMPEQVGANPTPIPFSEVYLALQQGVVDAQENPLTTIKYKRFYEVQSHISLTAHIANSLVVIMSGKSLERMSVGDRYVLEQVLQEAGERTTSQVVKQERELVQWYKDNGIVVVEPDRSLFRAEVLPALHRVASFNQDHLLRLLALDEKGSSAR